MLNAGDLFMMVGSILFGAGIGSLFIIDQSLAIISLSIGLIVQLIGTVMHQKKQNEELIE